MVEINKKENNVLIEAKIIDKYKLCNSRNKITYTDFLDMYQRSIAEGVIKKEKIKNYFFFGGKEEADRSVLIFYPDKLILEMVQKNLNDILEIIRIELPNENKGKYEHRDYLSGIMKLGIRREKFGDIVVTDEGADIITLKEISEYIKMNIEQLTRFRKAKVSIESIDELKNKEAEFDSFSIIVSSIRIDNFVSELARCSRSKAYEIIEDGRVFVNSENELRASRRVEEGDIISIRGKGKFIFDSVDRETRAGKIVVNIKKYR